MKTPVASDPERRRANVRPYPWDRLTNWSSDEVERINRLGRILPRRGRGSKLLEDLAEDLGSLVGRPHVLHFRGFRARRSSDDIELGDSFRTRFHLPPDSHSGVVAIEMELVDRWLEILLDEPPPGRHLGRLAPRYFGIVTYVLLRLLDRLKQAGAPPFVLPTAPPEPETLDDRLRNAGPLVELAFGLELEGRSHGVRLFLSEELLAHSERFADEAPCRRRRHEQLLEGPYAALEVRYPVELAGCTLNRSTVESLGVGDCLLLGRKISATADDRPGTDAQLVHRPGSRDRSLPGRLRPGPSRWQFEITDRTPTPRDVAMTDSADDSQKTDEEAATDLLDTPEVRLEVRVGTVELTLRELGDLSAGQILELDREVGDRVDLIADGTRIGAGELVDVEGRLGLRIERLDT